MLKALTSNEALFKVLLRGTMAVEAGGARHVDLVPVVVVPLPPQLSGLSSPTKKNINLFEGETKATRGLCLRCPKEKDKQVFKKELYCYILQSS